MANPSQVGYSSLVCFESSVDIQNLTSNAGYYVERRERGGEWLKVNNYPTPNTTFTVQDLHEGSKYEFRVIAVNEAGPGKPSKPTEPITAGHQRREYNDINYNNRYVNFLEEIVARKLVDHFSSSRCSRTTETRQNHERFGDVELAPATQRRWRQN